MTEPRRARQRDRLRDPETGEWDMAEVRHRLKGWAAVAVALAVIVGGGWFVGTRAWNAFMDFRTKADYVGAVGVADTDVEVPRGSSMAQIGSLLQEADVIKGSDAFVAYARTRPDEAAKVQAGTYKMRTEISAQAAFDRLLDPANLKRNMIQLREGQRLTEQLASMAELTKLPLEEFEALAQNKEELAKLGLPDWSGGNPEGFLFPETYEIPMKPTPADVFKVALGQFNKVAEDLDFAAKAEQSPAGTAYKALTMASLLEREAVSDEDRMKVARVFYNRLEKGMPLQSDATVAYANNITGRVFTTNEERQLDSPYNTYKNAGWIPGPITSPSRAAMEAAVNPAEGTELFFVVVNLDTGETVFSNTLEEHNAANNRLQTWCREQAPGRCK